VRRVRQSMPMTTRRGARPSQVRPRPPSSGRPEPAKIRPRAPTPGRLASHKKVERGPGIALPFRLLMGLAVVALGVGVLLIANGGLGRIAGFVGPAFDGFVANLTKTPAPSAPDLLAVDAPTLEAPDEPYTKVSKVDLVGTVPAAAMGQPDTRIRIYLALGKGSPGVVVEVAVPQATQHFTVPDVDLSNGMNTFTATIIGPTDVESPPSAAAIFILDTTKPKITISAPKANAIVNARTAQVSGTTQGRSTLSLHNLTTNQTVAGAADAKGAFSIGVPLGTGSNQIQVTATDPAGNVNTASITVRHGTGALSANLTSSFRQVKLSSLPQAVTLNVRVNDPDGRPLQGATVTFTLAVPGLPPITSSSLVTSSTGRASFTTTIPKGATTGTCSITVIVSAAGLGHTTDQDAITIYK
jgi:hypothetical protein